MDTSHFKILQVVVKFVFVIHEVIVSAVPKADVHFAIGNSNFSLFESFAVAIRTLTDEIFTNFFSLLWCKRFCQFDPNAAVKDSVHVLCTEVYLLQLAHSTVASVEVCGEIF